MYCDDSRITNAESREIVVRISSIVIECYYCLIRKPSQARSAYVLYYKRVKAR